MNPTFGLLALAVALACCLQLASGAQNGRGASGLQAEAEAAAADQQESQRRSQTVSEEMHLITKSLEDLLGELALIKREATGRLSNVKNRASTSDQAERIRQTKVSRFVLSRVAQLESESLIMRDELAKLFDLQKQPATAASSSSPSSWSAAPLYFAAASSNSFGFGRQEDQGDFDESPQQETSSAAPPATTQRDASTSEGMPATTTTTAKPSDEEEASKIGFDLEALKKLGDELDNELEARQQQTPESLRGVHQQVIKLVDTMVQTYLGNVRRTIERMTSLIESRRPAASNAAAVAITPRQLPGAAEVAMADSTAPSTDGFARNRQAALDSVHSLSRRMREFSMQWTRAVGKQQSPLIDRIPPRGVELWRDFWDTVRKQVRRINQEVWQLSRDMTRMVTGGFSSNNNVGPTTATREARQLSTLHYKSTDASKQFQEFYDKMSAALGEEQRKMDSLNEQITRAANSQAEGQAGASVNKVAANNNNEIESNLIDEQDDQMTKDELTRNPSLRQQIQQEISVFGSIFDIMQTFIQRLRESANNVIRDVLERPGASANNNNDPVTPGPSVKPQVDKLLDETIDSQRNINSNGKPVLLPNNRPNNRG